GFERVYETGHVYRAEPHATSRHLTEYYSLDFEVGFIDGPENIIQIERELLTYMFNRLMSSHGEILRRHGIQSLPSMLDVPTWEFRRCLELSKDHFGRTDLTDDLDPEGERQLCALAEKGNGSFRGFCYWISARRSASSIQPPGERTERHKASICCSMALKSRPAASACITGKT